MNAFRFVLLRSFCALILLSLGSIQLWALDVEFLVQNPPRQGNDIAKDSIVSAIDSRLGYMEVHGPDGFTNYKSQGVIYAKIDHNESTYVSSYSYEVLLEVKYKIHDSGSSFSTITIDTVSLYVAYDPDADTPYRDHQTFVVDSAYWIQGKIIDVVSGGGSVLGSVAANLVIGAKGNTERYYDAEPTTKVSNLSHSLTNSGSELEISWNAMYGVEWFDLEWTYFDNYTGAGGEIPAGSIAYDNTMLDSNATMVRLEGDNSYNIPLIYGKGYVVYRVRPVWLVGADFKQIFEGRWSDFSQSVTNLGQISNKYEIEPDSIHEPSLNWQYTATYAENGKRKEVVRYFDGTLRERQAVTKLYEQDETVVGEKIYDHQGRPAIEILPVPTNSPVMEYYRKFNLNASGDPYSRANFDFDSGSCTSFPDSLSAESGAGLYYGTKTATNERDTSGLDGYLPNAQGYPFVATRFTPDKTGRIKEKSGVGRDHRLGGAHTTEYYYPQPTQKELDRLFGTEIGYNKHYKKTMTIDPNGQVSITYTDLAGKTIATALSGESPENLADLSSNQGGEARSMELIGDNEQVIEPSQSLYALEVNFPFDISDQGDVSVSYSVTPEEYEDACLEGIEICMDCVYRLTISIKDDCGNELLDAGTHMDTIGTADGLCDSPIQEYAVTALSASALPEGTYYLTKTLYVDQTAANTYADLFIRHQTCITPYTEILYPIIDAMQIDDQCETNEPCVEEGCLTMGTCESFLIAMLADVSPGGQYAKYDYDHESGEYSASEYPLSLFNSNNSLPHDKAYFRNPSPLYKDEEGITDLIYYNGYWDLPNFMPMSVFIENWKPSWAESLVKYHPEYCYYEWCTEHQESMEFDSLMMATESFQDAWDLGLFNPLDLSSTGLGGVPDTLLSGDYTNRNTDPFFIDKGNPVDSLFDSMKNSMLKYYEFPTANVSIWNFILSLVYCPEAETVNEVNDCLANVDWGGDICVRDRLWEHFKGIYLSEKQRWYQRDRTVHAILNQCYNGCFNTEEFDTTAHNFHVIGGQNNYQSPGQPCYAETYEYYAQKIKRVPLQEDILGYDPYTSDEMFSDGGEPILGQAEISVACDSTCEGYADYWMNALKDCANLLVGEEWEPGQTTYDNIRAGLIEVCTYGCDENNPYGTSTTPPGESTDGGFTSFDSVLSYYLSGYDPQMNNCTAELIGMPKPYDHKYHNAGNSQYPKLDTCACTLLLDYSDDYAGAQELPEDVNSYEDYVSWRTGINFFFLEERLCACESVQSGGNWITGAVDSLEAWALDIPADITCPSCADCDSLQAAITIYESTYENEYEPAYVYRLLPNFLNTQLGWNLSYPEYIEFLAACDSIDANGVFIQDEFTRQAEDVEWLVESLLYSDNLGDNDVVELGQFPGLLSSSLLWTASNPSCWRANISWTYTDTLPKLQAHGYDDWEGYYIDIEIVDLCNTQDTCIIELQVDSAFNSFYNNQSKMDSVYYFSIGDGDLTLDAEYTDQCDYVDFKLQLGTGEDDSSRFFYGHSACYPVQRCLDGGQNLCDQAILTVDPMEDTNSCKRSLLIMAEHEAKKIYRNHLDSLRAAFMVNYNNFCLSNTTESLVKEDTTNEYHYTLYYYDRAGNLIQTIPPVAVDPLTDEALLDSVQAYRDSIRAGASYIPDTVHPPHNFALASTYQYTSFNQVFEQTTPDGGTTEFWYDNKGRLAASQNAKQEVTATVFVPDPMEYFPYSYTQYDHLGRIAEVGQLYALSDPTPTQINHTDWPFNWGHSEEEVVRTRYDIPLGGIPSDVEQNNLRNRVATTYYDDDGIDEYDYATHYTYDAHGNVDTLWQEYVPMAGINQDLKKLVYDYDLVSGNVNEVAYQEGHTDQFFHRYTYDSDNRITDVQTSRDGIIWNRDAGYSYYRHGPLARMEIGEHNVQGVDYAYTTHGWLKGVNSNVLEDNKDIGMDGNSNGPNGTFARDAFGFTLGYYEGDYIPINQRHTEALQNYFLASTSGTELGDASPDLWNGNIRHMVTSLMKDDNSYLTPQGTAYAYDQLNRLTRMQVFQGITSNEWDASGSSVSQHGVDTITYDANGNILSLDRNGDQAGGSLAMDRLSYNYYSNTNQLEYVDETVSSGTYGNDIDDQSAGNYDYDEIGNLTSDAAESIQTIAWYVNGKIKSIDRSITPTQSQPDLSFNYGPDGQRIRKAVTWSGGGDTTWYVRDAQGNVMAVYRERNDSLFVKEHYIYGSSRLGSIHDWIFVTAINAHSDSNRYSRVLGEKYYELSNHLGNVLATVTDQKKAHNSSGSVDYWEPIVASYSDYYPGGSLMPGRNGNGSDYRFGYQGSEKTSEVAGEGNHYTTYFRELDTRLLRWWAIDPKSAIRSWESPYVTMGNNPIFHNDVMGDSIPTKFYDADGNQTDIIPESVQNTFQQEYGITVGYANGKLYKAGDYETDNTVSADAKAEWEKVLGADNTEQSLVFGYDMAMDIIPIQGGQLDKPVVMGKNSPFQKTAFIDLADFEASGKISGAYAVSVGEGDFSMRANNLGRVLEHEFIGHGLLGMMNEDDVVNHVNIYRNQMGLPIRDQYEHVVERIGKIDLNNLTPPSHVVGQSYGNGSTILYYDRMPLRKMSQYFSNW